MRKLTSILAALVMLATCNAALAQTVPMVVTVNGNGTLTGSGITGTVVPHGTTATMILNVPALTAAAVTGTFSGTCNSANILYGNGTCAAPPAVTATQVTGAFTGTCNSGTYLNGGGSCTAPIITAKVPTTYTCPGNTGVCNVGLDWTGLQTGITYGLTCFLQLSNSVSAGAISIYLANGTGAWTTVAVSGTTVTGTTASGGTQVPIPVNPSDVTIQGWFNLNIGTMDVQITNSSSSASTTITAGSWCELVKP